MGVLVWPMVELEADDALAAAARIADADAGSSRSASGHRTRTSRSACAAIASCRSTAAATPSATSKAYARSSACEPARIPDLLALVGDTADGYPGIAGIGKVGAARLVNAHGSIEEFPAEVLGDRRELALLFKDLATLRSSATVLATVDELRWRGPTAAFAGSCRAPRRPSPAERALVRAGRLPQRIDRPRRRKHTRVADLT